MKKAQSAVEFLITYGWAFLVILVVIGALVYFDVLSPSRFIPDSCRSGDPLVSCDEYLVQASAASTADSVQLILTNQGSLPWNTLTVTGNTSSNSACSQNAIANTAAPIGPGSSISVNLSCANALLSGARVVESVNIQYVEAGKTLPKTARVDISANVP